MADEAGYRATVSYQTPDGVPLPAPQQPPGQPPPRAEPRQPTFLFSGPLPPLTADLGPGFGRRVGNGGDGGGGGPAGRPNTGGGGRGVPVGRPVGGPRPGGPVIFGGPAKRETGPTAGPRPVRTGPTAGPGPVRTGQNGPVSGGVQGGRGGGRSLPLSRGRPQVRQLKTPGPTPQQQVVIRGGPSQPPSPRGADPVLQQRHLPARPAADSPAAWSPEANSVPSGGDRVPPADHRGGGASWRLPASPPPPPPPPPQTASAWLVADNTIRHGWTSPAADEQPGSATSRPAPLQHGGPSTPPKPRSPTASAGPAGVRSARPAPTSDGSRSHRTDSPAGPLSSRQEQQTPPPSTRHIALAGFSARQGRLTRRPRARAASVRSPRRSGGFTAESSGPAELRANAAHPLALFINAPVQQFSPQLGEWNPMRIRT